MVASYAAFRRQCKPHSWGALNKCGGVNIAGVMKPQQKPIAEWMQGVLDRQEISARAWAEKAALGKDTVSRAIRDDYEHVTSTRTIAALAEAIGERPPGAAAAIPSAASLAGVMQVLLEAFAPNHYGQDTLNALGSSLRQTLLHLADEPDGDRDPKASRMLARAAIRRAPTVAG